MALNNFSGQTIRNDFQKFTTLDPQRKVMVVGLVFGLFLLSLIVGSYLSRPKAPRGEPGPQQQVPQEQNVTTLTVSPAQKTLKVGESQTVEVTLDKLPVPAADIVIEYDPAVLQVANVKNGAVFQRIIKNNVSEGKITYSGSINTDGETQPETGVLFSFTVKGLKEAPQTLLKFDPLATITALNGDNTLGQTIGGEYKVTK